MAPALKINVVCAPSRSRPRLSGKKVRADAQALRTLLGACGIGGLTEISNWGARRAIRGTFPRRVMPTVADAPIVLAGGWKILRTGRDFGCARIALVAPTRTTVWALLQDPSTGLKVGVGSTHMMPGGWAPLGAQRRAQSLILKRWIRHEGRINTRRNWLAARADVVVTLGDINHPKAFAFPGDTRVSAPGLVYIGVRAARGVKVAHTPAQPHAQNADHPAQSTVLTITKGA